MRVLHAIDKMNPKRGGVCQAVRTIVLGLTEFGVENEVVCLDAPNEEFLLHEDFTVNALGPSNNYWSYSRKLVPWLLENLCNFDVVIVHGLWQYPTFAINRVKRHLEKRKSCKEKLPKLFVMPHGMLDPYFQTASGRKLKAVRNILYWKLIEKKVVNDSNGILFTCEDECLLARVPFKPYSPKQEIIVGLGVEVPPAFSEAMKAEFILQTGIRDQKYFLFLSRIHEKKGLDILLEAYKKLKFEEEQINKFNQTKNYSTLPKLVIAGPGLETSYGKKIEQVVQNDSSLRENIIFAGMLAGNAKWGAFYGCEAFLLPSHQENFGIAIVEALACGKPVLTTNKVNIWREIESSGAGYISTDTVSGIFKTLQIWNGLEASKKKETGGKAIQCFRENFAVHSASKRLKNVLQS